MTGIIFATPDEAMAFLKQNADGRVDRVSVGERIELADAVVTVTGPGKIKATHETEKFLQECEVDDLIHAGGATALSDEFDVGAVVGANFVLEGDRVDLETPTYPRMPLEVLPAASAEGTLVTQDHESEGDEEQSYWERIAHFQDTTGYAVAYVAAQHGIPCHIVKGITPDADTDSETDSEPDVYEAVARLLTQHLEGTTPNDSS